MNISPQESLIEALNQIGIRGTWLVVAHDAGAANIIASWLPYFPKNIRICAQGPALKIFEDLGYKKLFCTDLEDVFSSGVDLLISGTGWQSSLEHDSRVLAQAKGICSIAVIDHWANYTLRFVRQGIAVYPNQVVVTDEAAYQVALQEFPNNDFKLSLWPNLYFVKQVDEINQLALRTQNSEHSILYLLEPMRKSWFGEFEAEFAALDFFFKMMEETGLAADKTIVLRPHPSEADNKYQTYLDKYSQDYTLRVDKTDSLSLQIANSSYIFGCCSFALVLAAAVGKQVYSTIPDDVDNFRLPHREIKPLQALRNIKN